MYTGRAMLKMRGKLHKLFRINKSLLIPQYARRDLSMMKDALGSKREGLELQFENLGSLEAVVVGAVNLANQACVLHWIRDVISPFFSRNSFFWGGGGAKVNQRESCESVEKIGG